MKRIAVILLLALLIFGCNQKGTGSSAEPVDIRWFVGLGAGSDEPTFAPQQAVVDAFNESHDNINLILEIVDAGQAVNTLATQIAAGNGPDLVGPVGIKGRDAFKGAWLDLTDLVKENDYDLSVFDPKMVDFYTTENGLEGLPFGLYPSFLYVNYELFDEAGLPYPPQEYGKPYIDENGKEMPWNFDTVRYLGMRLTVDKNGNDATMVDFDPDNIVQFGYGDQWTDWRGVMSSFGAGSIVDANNNAQIPEQWAAATKFYYDAMWKDYFYPNAAYGGADFLAQGNWFQSANMAMVHCHLWYAGFADLPFNWNTAVMPAAPDGKTTAKMHADTFEILNSTAHPEEAFEVLAYFVGDASLDLLNIYGGMPARLADQGDYFETFEANKWPNRGINWQVVKDSMAYADAPNHVSWMPSFQETTNVYNDFWDKLQNNVGLDVDAELAQLKTALQAVYDAADK
ncbi:MAG: extracellular solute-binding protein [Spirochaetaceae bacterium]|jgi:multiple sugar transport system substrate-binding protein|nr:extracellular solute-binding protein [Spirochaetaceae bacterium]